MSSIPVYTGIFAIIDLLGFKNYVIDYEIDDVSREIAEIFTKISSASNILQLPIEMMVYSDTIAIRLINNDEESFGKFIKVLQMNFRRYFDQLTMSYENPIPLRGAICYGEYSWYKGSIQTKHLQGDPQIAENINFIVGKGIIEAHDHESNQEWIGVSMTAKTVNMIRTLFPDTLNQLIVDQLLMQYPIPCKGNTYINSFAISPFGMPFNLERIFNAFVTKTLSVVECQKIDDGTKRKYINTLTFLVYLEKMYKRYQQPDGMKIDSELLMKVKMLTNKNVP